jgi:CubicO group peptidase (beta-lactamase class C family)
LLSNTSGLPDYFEDQQANGQRLFDQLKANKDTTMEYDDVIHLTQSLPAHFAPGEAGKAYYSDANFQLLGYIIEKILEQPLSKIYEERICQPLKLKSTYLYTDSRDRTPTPFYYENTPLWIPNMMSSFRSDGGLVTTSKENLQFLTAFFNGDLFSKKHLQLDENWNKIYPPFQYSLGLMKFKYPGVPEMIGHAGATGSFAFWIRDKNLFLVGTINQIAKPQLVYKMLAKISAKIS